MTARSTANLINHKDLASLKIRHVIFHDVPNNPRGSTNVPILADAVTEIDSSRREMLKNRLIRALNSKAAYEVEFIPESGSPLPKEVSNFTSGDHPIKEFVEMSQRLALYLAEQQGGNTSPGLLCVVDVAIGASAGVAILKLERERGVDIALREISGKRMFEMSLLDSLVFTDGTRLFKSALFVRSGKDGFRAAACDSQQSVASSKDLARFWLRFLGCRFVEDPRVATQKWFDATVRFVNECVSDPIEKNDIYEHLQSDLKSQRRTITPRRFAEECMPDDFRESYLAFLRDNNVSLQGFEKDTSDIKSKLRRQAFHTAKGVIVTVPSEESGLVDVETDQIVIHDQLDSIS